MDIFLPKDTVYKMVGMPLWQRDWINNHKAINFSGLVQEMILQIIQQNDPIYFEQYRKFLRPIRQKDTTPNIRLTVIKSNIC